MGALDFMSSACRVATPLLCGVFIDAAGPASPFVVEGALCAVAMVLAPSLREGGARKWTAALLLLRSWANLQAPSQTRMRHSAC